MMCIVNGSCLCFSVTINHLSKSVRCSVSIDTELLAGMPQVHVACVNEVFIKEILKFLKLLDFLISKA